MEWDIIVETVFLSFLNQMEIHLVQNRKVNCHHDHIPFNLKWNGILVFSVQQRPGRFQWLLPRYLISCLLPRWRCLQTMVKVRCNCVAMVACRATMLSSVHIVTVCWRMRIMWLNHLLIIKIFFGYFWLRCRFQTVFMGKLYCFRPNCYCVLLLYNFFSKRFHGRLIFPVFLPLIMYWASYLCHKP